MLFFRCSLTLASAHYSVDGLGASWQSRWALLGLDVFPPPFPSLPASNPRTVYLDDVAHVCFYIGTAAQERSRESGSFVKRILTRASGHARVVIDKYRFEYELALAREQMRASNTHTPRHTSELQARPLDIRCLH